MCPPAATFKVALLMFGLTADGLATVSADDATGSPAADPPPLPQEFIVEPQLGCPSPADGQVA